MFFAVLYPLHINNLDLIMEAIVKAVKLVVEALACMSEAYTKLKRISLEVDYEVSEDEDIQDEGTSSEDEGSDLETIEEDGEENEMFLQDII